MTFGLQRLSSAVERPGGNQFDGPVSSRVASATPGIMASNTLLHVSGVTGIERAICTASQVDKVSVRHGLAIRIHVWPLARRGFPMVADVARVLVRFTPNQVGWILGLVCLHFVGHSAGNIDLQSVR